MVVVGAPGGGLYALEPLGSDPPPLSPRTGGQADGGCSGDAPREGRGGAGDGGGGGGRGDVAGDSGGADGVAGDDAIAGGDAVAGGEAVVPPPHSAAVPPPPPHTTAPTTAELYRLPRRLVGVVYTRPGRHVIARRYPEADDAGGGGGKVVGEVVAALLDEHVDDLRRAGLWPVAVGGRGADGVATAGAVGADAAAGGRGGGGGGGGVDAGWGLPDSDSCGESADEAVVPADVAAIAGTGGASIGL